MKSDQRRRVVLDAAVACFARKGFYGTTTGEIAEQAGISQPYVYRLFANKEALFAGAVLHVSELISNALTGAGVDQAGAPRPSEAAMSAVRSAYGTLIQDRDVMRFLMHANCAADEPLVAEAVRECYARQVQLVSEILNHDDEAVRHWFGAGMLENVTLTLGLADVDEPWARTLSG
ncbi:TetR/AcrR family transcriptional regulator [Kineosporia mesophila]|uniref:TetR/AcrR family transcriptional regulator n=1 Tax=Kineosporia mesophila TaxID=566012 RepID=UPI001E5D6BCE|nr:TetR/AcrR family transcriptional regulator [Kineosporia mesophila]